MNIFLAIQTTYDHIELALFHQETVIDTIVVDKANASKDIVGALNTLFARNKYTLNNVIFIAAGQGPGPFTTLRTVLTTVNAIGFARAIPLIGIDNLASFFAQEKNDEYPNTIILLNAFNKDIYFAYQADIHQIIQSDSVYGLAKLQTGYQKIDLFLEQVTTLFPAQTIRFLGNGTQMYAHNIKQIIGAHAYIPEPLPLTNSMDTLGAIAWRQWLKNHTGAAQLNPLYLKKHAVEL